MSIRRLLQSSRNASRAGPASVTRRDSLVFVSSGNSVIAQRCRSTLSHVKFMISPRRIAVLIASKTIVLRYGFSLARHEVRSRSRSSSERNRKRPRGYFGFETFLIGVSSIHPHSFTATVQQWLRIAK